MHFFNLDYPTLTLKFFISLIYVKFLFKRLQFKDMFCLNILFLFSDYFENK